MFGIFTEEVDAVIGIKLSNTIQSMIKENECTFEIFALNTW